MKVYVVRLPLALMRQAAQLFGRRGGKKRAKNLSPRRRAEIARLAAKTRWKNAGKKRHKG